VNLPLLSHGRNSAEYVPKQCRSSAATVPKQCRASKKGHCHFRASGSVMLQLCGTLAPALAAGWAVSQGHLLFTTALPVLALRQPDRVRAMAAALAYFLVAGADILHVGPYLATTESASLPLWLFWLGAAFLQALVWCWCWDKEVSFLRASLALTLSALPPFGLIAWAHPFHAAGVLFPALGLTGLLCTLAVLEAATRRPEILLLAAALAFFNHRHVEPRSIPWSGLNTQFGDAFAGDDPLGVMNAVARATRENPAVVQVWPESIVPHWNEATEAFWSDIISDAKRRGKTIVFGSTIGIPDPLRLRLRNVAIIQGREERLPVDQRTPILGATWHPTTGTGVPLLVFASPIRELAAERAAFLICYEQLIAWSYLMLLVDRPTVLVGMANTHWVTATSIPAVQTACLQSWARLFNIPLVQAVNR
jgi:hypothetical protein